MLSLDDVIALPIDPYLPEILERLKSDPCLVLRASPGSGKTTRVPPALLSTYEGEILVLEPRRLAAKYAATRIAEERGERVGEVVGYQFRFENVTGPRTRLRFLTEGMLMRRLLGGDPSLRRTKIVVLDEFHERHLHGDIALSYLRQLQRSRRPDLKIVVMSATLDTDAVSRFLGGCSTLSIDAPRFPVSIEYLPQPAAKPLESIVREATLRALTTAPSGDVLIFLPGMGEIRACEAKMSDLTNRHKIALHVLHGDISREAQDDAIRKGSQRKVILSTNVAETSLTIEGVESVIDSGLHRQASHSWWSGVPSLRVRPISRASAEQRAGRAGRTAPGNCFRLYTRHDFETRTPFEPPEIHRADLAQTLLELKCLGIEAASHYPWFEPPTLASLATAAELLYRLGALCSNEIDAPITELGRKLAQIPSHPRIARFLVEAALRGALPRAADFAATLMEGGNISRIRDQLLSAFSRDERERGSGTDDDVAFSLLTGYPDRVAKRRGRELVFSGGGSARLGERERDEAADTFVVLEVQELQHAGQARAQWKVREMRAIDESWLFDVKPSPLRETEVLEWDPDRKKVVAASRIQYDTLVLAESFGEPSNIEEAVRLALKAGLGLKLDKLSGLSLNDWISTLAAVCEPDRLETAMGRLKALGETDTAIADALRAILSNKRAYSLAAFRETDWPTELLAAFPLRAGELDRLVPTQITLPTGRRTPIHYSLAKGPWMQSRLQDFFGMKQGPSILGGRIALTLHLLAPNQRAVQVTSDLAGFWDRAYPTIRKELSRKYPRHAWPENPRDKFVAPKRP